MGNVTDLRSFLLKQKGTKVEKNTIVTGDINDFGIVNPEQGKRFIDKMREHSALMNYANITQMTTPVRKISKIDFLERFLRDSTEGSALTAAEKSSLDFSETTLQTYKKKGEIDISYETLEDNIERSRLLPHIQGLITEKLADEIGDLCINGDTTSTDPFYQLFDGFFAQAASNVYDLTNNIMDSDEALNVVRSMPDRWSKVKYQTGTYILRPNVWLDYQDSLTSRETPLGDAILTNKQPVGNIRGYSVWKEPIVQTYINGTDTNSKGLFTDPKNLLVGIYRPVKIRIIDDQYAEKFTVQGTVRFGCVFIEEEMVVLIDNIKQL